MNKKKKYPTQVRLLCLALVAGLMLCPSCSAGDEEQVGAGTAISFATGYDANTAWNEKVVEMDGVHISTFTVNAANVAGEGFDFMANQVVVRDMGSTSWSYSPLRYWPQDGSTVRFYAYSPAASVHVQRITTLTGSTAEITYRVPLNDHDIPIESIQEDFLVASATVYATRPSAVSLPFVHTLAHLSFNVTNALASDIAITGIKLLYLDREGILPLPINGDGVARWNANTDYISHYKVSFPSTGIVVAGKDSTLIGETDGLVILPQNLTGRLPTAVTSLKPGEAIPANYPSDAGADPLAESSYLAITYYALSDLKVYTKYIPLRVEAINKKYKISISVGN